MKKIILLSLLMLSSFLISAQNIKTDKYEVYLSDYLVSEVNISKGMYMTQNKQYFYEGTIEVVDIDINKSKLHQFYFSTWDKDFKQFIVKDANFNEISPEFTYINNKEIKYQDRLGAETIKPLNNSSTEEFAILSSMLVWIENFPSK